MWKSPLRSETNPERWRGDLSSGDLSGLCEFALTLSMSSGREFQVSVHAIWIEALAFC